VLCIDVDLLTAITEWVVAPAFGSLTPCGRENMARIAAAASNAGAARGCVRVWNARLGQ